LAAIVGAAYLLLPSATVTLQPETEMVGTVVTVTGSTGVSQPNAREAAVPARPTRVSVPIEITGPATGPDVAVGDKHAIGRVQFINRGEDASFIPAGTAVSTDDGRRFQTLIAVNLPSDRDATVSVNAQAVDSGESGNVDAALIKKVEGIGDHIVVTNERPFSGGTNRTVKLVTESDLNNLRTAARRIGRERGLRQIVEDSRSQSFPIADSIELGLADERLNAKPGEPADYLIYNAVAVLNLLAVDQKDLLSVTTDQIAPNGEGLALLANSVSARPVLVRNFNAIDQKFDMEVLATGSASRPIDHERVREITAGKQPADAERLLRREFSLRSVTIDAQPPWIGLPRLAQRIAVQVQP
jgi:hypothetical protein